ncbi:MAG: GNAT family N-acetyltransferase [Defluviitaleaceae bacterium]|nr:GNAT family N-acetyltransferase [Defluviitaleaceae bacterium]
MVRYATQDDLSEIEEFDRHIPEEMLEKAVDDGRVLVYKNSEVIMGIARWNYFWDSIPFLNMLYVPSGYTRCGVGSQLLKFWESEMQKQKHRRVLTSTMSKEKGQHFLRKFGYRDIGNLYDEGEGLELILEKRF